MLYCDALPYGAGSKVVKFKSANDMKCVGDLCLKCAHAHACPHTKTDQHTHLTLSLSGIWLRVLCARRWRCRPSLNPAWSQCRRRSPLPQTWRRQSSGRRAGTHLHVRALLYVCACLWMRAHVQFGYVHFVCMHASASKRTRLCPQLCHWCAPCTSKPGAPPSGAAHSRLFMLGGSGLRSCRWAWGNTCSMRQHMLHTTHAPCYNACSMRQYMLDATTHAPCNNTCSMQQKMLHVGGLPTHVLAPRALPVAPSHPCMPLCPCRHSRCVFRARLYFCCLPSTPRSLLPPLPHLHALLTRPSPPPCASSGQAALRRMRPGWTLTSRGLDRAVWRPPPNPHPRQAAQASTCGPALGDHARV